MTQPFSISVAKPQEGGRSGAPLVRFKGTLKEHTIGSEGDPGKERVVVTFNFTDVIVIESDEPYNFPIAVIKLSYSDKSGTQWAAFTESYRALVPESEYAGAGDPLSPLDGKSQEWYYGACKLRRPLLDDQGNTVQERGRDKWTLQDSRGWQIVGLEGYGAAGSADVSLMDMLVDYADGKKDQEIYSWLYTDQGIKNKHDFNDALAAAADRTLLGTLVSAGRLKLNPDTTYTKVA